MASEAGGVGGALLRARNMAERDVVVGGGSGDEYCEDKGEDSVFKAAVEVFRKLKVLRVQEATPGRGAG